MKTQLFHHQQVVFHHKFWYRQVHPYQLSPTPHSPLFYLWWLLNTVTYQTCLYFKPEEFMNRTFFIDFLVYTKNYIMWVVVIWSFFFVSDLVFWIILASSKNTFPFSKDLFFTWLTPHAHHLTFCILVLTQEYLFPVFSTQFLVLSGKIFQMPSPPSI